MKTVEELIPLIEQWAEEKGIDNPERQYLKILEEVGETAAAILRDDQDEIKDGIGDIAVTVIIYYWQKKEKLFLDFEIHATPNYWLIFEFFLSDLYESEPEPLMWVDCLAHRHNTTLKECLNIAWSEIKDRKGKTVNGTFIKE